MKLDLTINIKAQPQGSKRPFVRNGRAVLVESSKDLKKNRDQFSQELKREAEIQNWVMPDKDTPVECHLWFAFKRPKTVFRKFHTVRPDVDKTVRFALDAVTNAGIWHDDSQVVKIVAHKYYTDIDQIRVVVSYESI